MSKEVEGMVMQPEVQAESDRGIRVCHECGAEESGYFCRSCGALLRGDDRVLCPRCRQVVPLGDFCNQCGQGLSGVALSLKQLAIAGDTFWVSDEAPMPASSLDLSVSSLDSSMELAQADMPDWLYDLPVDSELDGQPHIYPALQPMRRERKGGGRGLFVTVAVLLMGLLLVFMMILVVVFLLLRGG